MVVNPISNLAQVGTESGDEGALRAGAQESCGFAAPVRTWY